MQFNIDDKIIEANKILKEYYLEINYPMTSTDNSKIRTASLSAKPKNINKIFNSPFRISLDRNETILKFYLSSINYNIIGYYNYNTFIDELNKVINDINILNNLELPIYKNENIVKTKKR